MKRVPAPGLRLVVLLAAALPAARASLDDLPGAGKPAKSGYVITVEGGEQGEQTAYYSNDGKRRGSAPPGQPAFSTPPVPAPAPAPATPLPAVSGAPGGPPPAVKNIPDVQVDSPLNKVTTLDQNLAGRRFDRSGNPVVGTDQKFPGRDPVTFGKWTHGDETFTKETAPGVDMSERFKTDSIDKNVLVFDRRDREMFARGEDHAEIGNWAERFSRDRSGKFSVTETTSPIGRKFTEAYTTLMQVSMQDINRYQFRRNHSSEKGALPVGKIGSADVTTTVPRSGE